MRVAAVRRALALGLLAAAAPAAAETRVGVFAAATQSFLSVRGAGNTLLFDGHGSFGGGGLVAWDLEPNLTLELQGSFVSKGDEPWAVFQPLSPDPGSAGHRLAYFEAPLFVKCAIPLGEGGERAYVLTGPALALRRRATLLAGGEARDIGASVRRLDLGLGLGAGVRFPTGIFFEGQYTWGLVDIDRGRPRTRNRTLQFRLGVAVPLFGRS